MVTFNIQIEFLIQQRFGTTAVLTSTWEVWQISCVRNIAIQTPNYTSSNLKQWFTQDTFTRQNLYGIMSSRKRHYIYNIVITYLLFPSARLFWKVITFLNLNKNFHDEKYGNSLRIPTRRNLHKEYANILILHFHTFYIIHTDSLTSIIFWRPSHQGTGQLEYNTQLL